MSTVPVPSPFTLTSFAQLFGQDINGSVVSCIEIPLIQRDYAQGRLNEAATRIRRDFLNALHQALTPTGQTIGLDFVYGIVDKSGAFTPLDGQQRLTTLLLLHWYLAWRAGIAIQNQPWTKFTYATRSSARLFCERLTQYQPTVDEIKADKVLSVWLKDQPWYLYTWQYDPTIQSMLVMLDAMHALFSVWNDDQCSAAWAKLTQVEVPAISFHLLPLQANVLTDDLYIKMNSRGKPLTPFEHFKANFEMLLKKVHPGMKASDFAQKVDTQWADTLWPYRDKEHQIDAEFMRYFRFVTEVCAWQSGVSLNEKQRTDDLAGTVYGVEVGNKVASDNLDFLMKAFDVWHTENISVVFDGIFSTTAIAGGTPLRLFNSIPSDLFGACCKHYGEADGKWTLAHTLLLYAVLLDRIHDKRLNANLFSRQLRILRNLIEATQLESKNMPGLLADVNRVIVEGNLLGVTAFSQSQIANEKAKATLLAAQPGLESVLYALEDHDLLRGCLAAFDLGVPISPIVFQQRADAFHALFSKSDCWPELTGALLAVGDYSRKATDRWTGYHFADFGASQNASSWRELFKGRGGENLHRATSPLMILLDHFANGGNALTSLATIQDSFLRLQVASKTMDWRYYFVKYPAMREGVSGRYAFSPSGYSICMLNYLTMHGYYRDPYLLAILRHSGVASDAVDDPWFGGYETVTRRMKLKKSGIRIQCVDSGWQITDVPTDPTQKVAFDQICLGKIDPSGLLSVSQNNGVDTSDRVAIGAQVLKDLLAAGL